LEDPTYRREKLGSQETNLYEYTLIDVVSFEMLDQFLPSLDQRQKRSQPSAYRIELSMLAGAKKDF